MYEGREIEEVKLDGMRKTIAARLTEAKQTIPHFYLRRDIKLDALMKFRAQLNKQLEGRGVKLSVNDFIIKACANAGFRPCPPPTPSGPATGCCAQTLGRGRGRRHRRRALHAGPEGCAHEIALGPLGGDEGPRHPRPRPQARAARICRRHFAISNLGMFGIDNFDAVINPPHGAILAVGAGVKKPVVGEDGELTVATVMSVTLSVDHRVIDGALGAELLQAIVDNLENPMVMLA
jgi:pyruvate dehydrogenase E2 component (dihydrolipoamide acetyltransferase)